MEKDTPPEIPELPDLPERPSPRCMADDSVVMGMCYTALAVIVFMYGYLLWGVR